MLDLRLVTPPSGLVVELDIARQHLRQDQLAEDVMIELYLQAAVQSVQDATGRALLPQTWELRLDEAPCHRSIDLPMAPLLSVEAISFSGVPSLDATYTVAAPSGPTCGPGRVTAIDGGSWPSGAAVIRFTAGYASADHVPAPLKAAVLLALGSLYENREAEAEKSGASARMLAANPAFARLIRPYQLIG